MSAVAPAQIVRSTPAVEKTPAINFVDPFLALRGLAAFLVLMGHCNYRQNLIHIWNIAGHNVSWLINPNASASVIIFFTLSGYLMGKLFYSGKYSLERASVLKFWKNRALRICPLYYALVLFIGLFAYTGVFKPENWLVLTQVLTFTYGDFSKDIFSGQFWSISTEMQFYLLVPFIIAFLKPRVRSVPAVLGVMAVAVGGIEVYKYFVFKHAFVNGALNPTIYWSYVYSAVWANLDAFLIGLLLNPLISFMAAHRRVNKLAANAASRKYAVFASWVLMAICAGWTAKLHYAITHRTSSEFITIPLIAALCTAVFIVLNELFNAQKQTPLNFEAIRSNPRRLLDLLGVLSYGIYLWHFCVINRVEMIVGVDADPLVHFAKVVALTTAFSAALASITYLAIEKPCNRYRKAK